MDSGDVFTVIVTSTDGCMDTSTVEATVFSLPICSASTGGDICASDTLCFYSKQEADATFWTWSSDAGATIINPNSDSPKAVGVTNGETFKVIIRNANGCIDSCTVDAVVNPDPSISFNSTTCALDLLTYTVNVTATGGTVTATSGTVTNVGGNDYDVSGIDTANNVTVYVTTVFGMYRQCSCECPELYMSRSECTYHRPWIK